MGDPITLVCFALFLALAVALIVALFTRPQNDGNE